MSFPRYESYKDSGIEWLGSLPLPWQHASLRHACRRITDGSHFSPKSIDNGKFYVTVRNIDSGKVDLREAAQISSDDFEQLEKAGCRPSLNDVLFSKDGTVGKVAIVENDDFVVLSSLAIISPQDGRLISKFLFYFLQSANGGKQIESLYAGAALRRITLDAIVGIWLPLPKLPEQQTIANFLDHETAKIDALIAEQQRLVELLKEKRQAVISHAITKGLNPNAQMKDSDIEWLGEVPAHWKIVAIKRVASICYGIGEPPQYQLEGTPLIRATNVHNGKLLEAGLVFVNPADIPDKRIVWLSAGDIIVVRSGAYTGDSAIIPEGYTQCIAGFDMVLHCSGVLPNFVQFALLSKYLKEGQIDLEKTRAAQPHLNAEELGSSVIVFPNSVEEQQAITTFLDQEIAKLDTLTAEAQRGIELLKERRTALISAAVTGKIDVRLFALKESA
jgi:type I restriction enzyme S subunit